MPEPSVSGRRNTSRKVRSFSSLASKRELVIIGAGGFGTIAASVADDINRARSKDLRATPWEVIGYADSDPTKRGTQRAGRTVLGNIEEVSHDFQGHSLWFFCAIGDNGARAKMVKLAESLGWKPATLIHPTAILIGTPQIGAGSYIGPASVVAVNAKLGAYAIIDMHVSIGHDVLIKDYCAVFPGARITGSCRVGEFAVVGSNATLLPGTVVEDRAVVGANSLAHGLVEPDTTILGVPGRVILRRTNRSCHA